MDRLQSLRNTANNDENTRKDLSDPVGLLLNRMMGLIAVITDSPTILRLFLDNIGVTKPNCAAEFVETLGALDADLAAFLDMWQNATDMKPALRQDRTSAEMVDGLIAFMIHGAMVFKSHQITDRSELEGRLRRHVEAFLLK